MSTVQTWHIKSESIDATLLLAASIGQRLQGGEVIELRSDLGGGKTAFVRGLAAGLGSNDQVSSPSFTLSNQYVAAALTLYHFDFYRLTEPGIMREELVEVIADPQAVVAVEWADIVEDVLPDRKLTITIIPTGEEQRMLQFEYVSGLMYLLKGLIQA
jgi:tRNA threonylcarbamoyladenosine biosynthesis protein TsaE